MKRLLLILGILAILGIGLGPWAYRTFFNAGEPIEMTAYDYQSAGSWALLPAEVPPPVWTDGWAIDVILIGPDASLTANSTSALARQTEKARHQAGRMSESLSAVGPVYAPLYRAAAADEDLAAAFAAYARTHNRGRAFVIATDHPLPQAMLAPLKSDESLRERFGGFLRLTRAKGPSAMFPAIEGTDGATGASLSDYCPGRFATPDGCQPVVEIGRQDGMMIVSQDGPIGGEALTGFAEWLEANVAKTAEPLGSLEEVEIIDIRRPGDTDAKRAEDDDGN